MPETRYYATGRRKRSIARVWISSGNGDVKVNNKGLLDYFGRDILKMIVERPFEVVDSTSKYDVFATVKGGGLSGQAGAMRLGISRALLAVNTEFRKPLREFGLLTRDPREKERKKYGLAKRRKRFQYSKR